MYPTLAEKNHDTTIVQVDMNAIINDDSSTKVENLVLNLEKNAIKLRKIVELKTYAYLASFSRLRFIYLY